MQMSHASVLPLELVVEILSWLPVKSLMRLKCVSKTWNSFIFDPTCIKLHLERSSKNTHILLTFNQDMNPDANESVICACVSPCSVRSLLENPFSTIDDCLHPFNRTNFVFGSCNGLVCSHDSFDAYEFEEYGFRFWNLAIRIMCEDSPRLVLHRSNRKIGPYFGFGYDDGSDTYKVVVVLLDILSQNWEVMALCLGDTCWRKVLTCPVFPLLEQVSGQFVSGTLNWLALSRLTSDYHWETVTVKELVIFSYDLRNETHRYLLTPNGLFEVPLDHEPYLGVLNGCLYLSHDDRRTHHFVVWLMREFGVEESWTQLLNVRYEHLFPIHGFLSCKVMALCMFENEDVLLLPDDGHLEHDLVLYSQRDNRINRTGGFIDFKFSFFSYNYVQSLVLPYRN